MKYWLLFAGVAALVPVLDQLTKYFVRTFLQVGESVSVWGNFFRIHYILNDGMAFGSFGGARWVFMIFTPIALAAIVYYLCAIGRTFPPYPPFPCLWSSAEASPT